MTRWREQALRMATRGRRRCRRGMERSPWIRNGRTMTRTRDRRARPTGSVAKMRRGMATGHPPQRIVPAPRSRRLRHLRLQLREELDAEPLGEQLPSARDDLVGRGRVGVHLEDAGADLRSARQVRQVRQVLLQLVPRLLGARLLRRELRAELDHLRVRLEGLPRVRDLRREAPLVVLRRELAGDLLEDGLAEATFVPDHFGGRLTEIPDEAGP